MFIQTEPTPNPATLKLLPGRIVLGDGSAEFRDAAAASRSPLASRLFGVPGVSGVFLGQDFVTVTKSAEADWPELKAPVLAAMMEHFSSGAPAIEDGGQAQSAHAAHDPADDGVVVQIKELLDTRVRPAVAQDGGDIVFHGFDRGIVYLHMQGACAGCPSSTATLKAGIEQMLKYYVPEVAEVRAVNV